MSKTVPWPSVGLFLAIAFGLAWALMLPFHLGVIPFKGLWISLFGLLMMWTPTLATAIVVATLDRSERWWVRLGLGVPGGRWGRWIGFMGLAWFAPILLNLIAPFAAAAIGWVVLDLEHFSGYRAIIEAQLEASGIPVEVALGGLPIGFVVAVQPLNMVIGAAINSVVGTFGEELGWRGWLQPALRPLGIWPAYALTGVAWGFWHAPIILLGYNYPSAPVLGVFLFVPFCMVWSVLLGWTRERTGSVWPAVLGHGAINASGGAVMLLAAAEPKLDMVWAPPVGIFMILFLVPVVALIAIFGWRTRSAIIEPGDPTPPAGPADTLGRGGRAS